MAINAIPAIDVNVCSGWTENQINLYNALPFYLAKMQVSRRQRWTLWEKLMKKRKWTPNMGPILKAVRPEPSPLIRQFVNPQLLSSPAKKDVIDIREVTEQAQLYHQKFESPALNFYPSFNDFMDNVDNFANDLNEKIERFEDLFYRTRVFHLTPFAFIAQGNSMQLIQTPYWPGTGNFVDGNDGKTPAFVAAQVPNITSHLTLPGLNWALNVMETTLRIPFYKGGDLPQMDQPLSGKYCLITSPETFNQFALDPFMLANKNCSLDVINDVFRGNFFGRITSQLASDPIRFQNPTAGGIVVYPTPEIRVAGGVPYNAGESVSNTAYSDLDENGSPFEVSWLCGDPGYEVIQVGPPPASFTQDTPPGNFSKMEWNGRVIMTKNKLVPCVDADTGATLYETNVYGEYLWFVSHLTLGILPTQRRNIIPIFHKRKRGL